MDAFGTDVVHWVAGLDCQVDGLATRGLDEELRITMAVEDQGGFLRDVIRGHAATLKLLASKDQALVIGRNALCILKL